MSIPLQRLRDLLPFSRHPASGGFVSTADGSPNAKSIAWHRVFAHIDDVLLPQIMRQRGLLQRFRQLEAACQEAEPALAEIERQTSAAPLPLPPAVQAATLQADNLIKRLAQCYGDIVRSVIKRQGSEPVPLFYRAIQRAMAMLARRQLLAHRACALPSTSSWQQLHALYRTAHDPDLQALNGDTALIEHEYLGALLLAYLDPQRLSRGDLDTVHRCAQQLAAYAVVSAATAEALARQTTEASFLVRPEDGHPGLPLSRLKADSPFAGGLLIDCGQVLAAIDRNISRQPGKPVQPDLAAPPALLQSLRVALGGCSARRFGRARFRPRADLVGGLGAVIQFLDGNAYTRRALDAPGWQNGRPTGEWSLLDESPDGFLVRFVRGEQCRFSAGQVVVLQPRESSRTHLCLVRRVVSVRSRLELGLQLLSPQVSIVALPGAGNSRAIFLHSLPAYGSHAGLITAPRTLRGKQRLTLKIQGHPIERQIGRTLEANGELELVALEPMPG
ncbi:MAG: hypothetical protein FWC58_01070 [Desulfobulbus sp.]|nr:hypothetical protein [Desulfobulbus sp.]